MAVITIIGAGMMGSALAFPAAENRHEVRLVGTPLDEDIIAEIQHTGKHPKLPLPFPAGVTALPIAAMEKALIGCDLVIGGVSSFGVEWFGETVLPCIPDGLPVITVTKGLIDTPEGKLLPYPDYWASVLEKLGKNVPLCAIGGPCTSYELVWHDQTEVCFAGPDLGLLRKIRELLRTDYYHISLSTDMVGIESAVALKNGYALGIALTIGVNQRVFGEDSPLHFNSQAAVFGQSVREMGRLLELQGASSPDNLVVGAGDLYVTVYGGRTRQIGILLGKGLSLPEARKQLAGVTLESLVVAERVARAVKKRIATGELSAADYPLLLHVDEILTGGKPVNIPYESFTFEKE